LCWHLTHLGEKQKDVSHTIFHGRAGMSLHKLTRAVCANSLCKWPMQTVCMGSSHGECRFFEFDPALATGMQRTQDLWCCSLLQPSDEIAQTFGKLLVLTSKGKHARFGPIDHQVLLHVFVGPVADPALGSRPTCDLVLNHNMHENEKKAATVQRCIQSMAHTNMAQELVAT